MQAEITESSYRSLLRVDFIPYVWQKGGMPREKRTVWFYTCTRCGYEWQGRTDTDPTVCAKCKSPYWDKPRRVAASKKKKPHGQGQATTN
jgi:DNA-directed RNA polymerase subunit RPC12/RpoP